ncbi:hypothetical protein Saut_0444 [Sulfurimonas autotrophica DSM 16294]|uniref:Uncharacterized protein n=1 Tax=Sulfurimonas autotrophica (strain ATCC BAA-671 / DSM 16294 / JCM 11897 / OK10) TaxID=563040 RepID=E0UUY1_SULAO|nr:hypothetical protein Saut_0444 [Sulfurimonas autotrophica DSM 16294]
MNIENSGSIVIAIVSALILGFALWIVKRMSNL